MAIYTLKNRFAGKAYVGMHNGKVYEIADTLAVPDYIAIFLRDHAIIRDNPISGEREYSLGILELKDDISPLDRLPEESMDRSDTDYPKAKLIPYNTRTARPAPRSGPGAAEVASKER